MTPDLEMILYGNYPEFFEQRNWSKAKTCMVWGCETGDGWFSLIEACAETITNHAREIGRPVSQATQTKEKFGGLRLYLGACDDFDFAATMCAEALSYWVCEVTGRPGRLTSNAGWYQTRCPEKARQYGVIFRSAMPRPSRKKYPSVLAGSIEVPYGWRRITDCMLERIRSMDKTPLTIDGITAEDNNLIISTEGPVSDFAAGAIAFTKDIARRTDKRTGAMHVPAISEKESHDGDDLS